MNNDKFTGLETCISAPNPFRHTFGEVKMRKFVSVALVFICLVSILTPVFAQKALSDRVKPAQENQTQFGEIAAFTEGTGVLVKWEMIAEANTAGYNVYRLDRGGKYLVNETMVVGSWKRSRATGNNAGSYQVFDPEGGVDSKYVIECHLISGERLSGGKSGAILVDDMEKATGISVETLQNVARSANGKIEHRTSELPSDLADIVSSAMQAPDPDMQRWVASQPGAKISVKKDGFYRVTANELVGAEFPVTSDPTKWRLFLEGVEQAIIVHPTGQYIEFYGRGIDLPETDSRIYFLISGTEPGKRIGSKVLRQFGGNAVSNNYQVAAQKKERKELFSELFNYEDDNYLGRLIQYPDPLFPTAAIPITLTGIDFSQQNVEIKLNLWGFTNGNHRVRVRINDHALNDITGFGPHSFNATLTIPTSHLLEGTNSLVLESSVIGDYSIFDSFTVKYARKYAAEGDKISFFTPGYKKVDLTGFTTASIRVFDLTFDGTPVLISNPQIVGAGNTFTAKLPAGRSMIGYAVENSALLQSPYIRPNKPSTLSADTNGADMLIISYSPAEFMTAAEIWATYRRSAAGGSNTVKVIDVADIYDEFNFGLFGSAGIESFLEYAHTEWQTQPKYVLFVGDSSHDPRNYEGWGYFDFIPSKSVTLILEESFSDEALGDFDDDGLAEMAIGRIPARLPAQITTAYNKTVLFETPALQNLNRGTLFTHDVFNGFDFASMSQIMSQELPVGTPVSMVDRGSPTSSTEIIEQMNAGKFIVNYSGHGSPSFWASSAFFGNARIQELTNSGAPSIYTMLTCRSGYFLRPNPGYESLGETVLLLTNSGAVATWASTSETTPDIQLIMGTRFFDQMSEGTIKRLGDLIRDAKVAIPAGADVRQSWVLLGDPMLKVR